jgi:hypothetical protein
MVARLVGGAIRANVALGIALGVALGALGCSAKPSLPPPRDDQETPDKRAGGSGDAKTDAQAAIELGPTPLGLADLDGFRWRKRPGQPAFRAARKAEARDDWAAVVTTCRDALAADPSHLEAAWLLAIGYAKLGALEQVLSPLSMAESGEFAKWGQASLEHPALAAFRATPVGEAFQRRLEQDRARYAAAVARAVIVTADGELYAFVPDSAAPAASSSPPVDGSGGADSTAAGRWQRLTRTGGVVVGAIAVPTAHKIAYVARLKQAGKRELGVGVVDLARGTASRPVPVGATGPIAIAYSPAPPIGFWIGGGTASVSAWRQLDDEFRFRALPARTSRPRGPWLSVTPKGTARLHALPANLTADWDDQSLASAMRIASSNRVVSVSSPGLIDGNTVTWSPDRVHVAFVAQLDDHCTAGAVNTAAFVADASTGGTTELERAAGGIAVSWLAERKLAIAGDHGVTIRSLDDGAPPIPINGATGLLIPRDRPRCAPTEPAEAPVDDPDAAESSSADTSVDAVDAVPRR